MDEEDGSSGDDTRTVGVDESEEDECGVGGDFDMVYDQRKGMNEETKKGIRAGFVRVTENWGIM